MKTKGKPLLSDQVVIDIMPALGFSYHNNDKENLLQVIVATHTEETFQATIIINKIHEN